MKALTKSEKIKAFIAPKMTYIITFLDKNGKSTVYEGGYIHGLYRYIEMIGYPTTLTTSGHGSHNFGSSLSIKSDATTLQPVIVALRMRQNSICECCERIGHKVDACIIRGTKLLPPSLRRNMNQFNALNGDEPKDPPREWNSQPTADHKPTLRFNL